MVNARCRVVCWCYVVGVIWVEWQVCTVIDVSYYVRGLLPWQYLQCADDQVRELLWEVEAACCLLLVVWVEVVSVAGALAVVWSLAYGVCQGWTVECH